MDSEKNHSTEKTQMAFQAHMAHYEALRADIAQATGLQNNLVNY